MSFKPLAELKVFTPMILTACLSSPVKEKNNARPCSFFSSKVKASEILKFYFQVE